MKYRLKGLALAGISEILSSQLLKLAKSAEKCYSNFGPGLSRIATLIKQRLFYGLLEHFNALLHAAA